MTLEACSDRWGLSHGCFEVQLIFFAAEGLSDEILKLPLPKV